MMFQVMGIKTFLIYLIVIKLCANLSEGQTCAIENFLFPTLECPSPSLRVSDGPAEPWLTRIDPGEVGTVKTIQLTEDRNHRRITLASHPPLFEIPGFLNSSECEHIIRLARQQGLREARTGSYDSFHVDKPADSPRDLLRLASTTFLRTRTDPTLVNIQKRVSRLTLMPIGVVQDSEDIQVGFYRVHGHYHAHFDTGTEWSLDDQNIKPCCFQTGQPHVIRRCNICRYITVMIYLSDVEEGGETAFPAADLHDKMLTVDSLNLSLNCYKATRVVKPRKGTAVFWYNNLLDEQTGWLGEFDSYSLHGGCDVIRGEKWIANFWLNAPNYVNRNLPLY